MLSSLGGSGASMGQAGGMMGGMMGGGKGKKEDDGDSDISGGLPGPIGAFENALGGLGNSQFAESQEYGKQRAQGLPEVAKAQLQDVQPATGGASGWDKLMKSDKSAEAAPAMDTTPVQTEDEAAPFALPQVKEEDEDISSPAYKNALKSFLRGD